MTMMPKPKIDRDDMGPDGFRVWATALVMAVLASLPGGVAAAGAPGLAGPSLESGRRAVQVAEAAADDKLKDQKESILAEVKRAVAAYFGVSVDTVSGTTDLVADLYADSMDALEVLAQLCDRFEVPFPQRDDLTSVEALASYISWAKQNPDGGDVVERPQRGGRPTGGTTTRTFNLEIGGEPPAGTIYRQTVFFGTDRRQTEESDPNQMFGGERGSATELTYGVAEVSIPVSIHKKGQMERPNLFKFEFVENAKSHIVLQRVTPLKREDFMQSLNAFMEKEADNSAKNGDAFVFVHGYNVTFDRAARRTAQIAYDLEFPGVPILFSWPSDGKFLNYLADREDAEWSVPHLEAFLNDLREMSKVKRLHLIAHSMGNQALIRALSAIAVKMGNESEPMFTNVILAAPDFDAGAFTDFFAARIRALSKRWTIYASDKDRALDASQVLSVPRLGTPLVVAKGMDTIDASGIDVTPWSVPEFHSYYANKKRMIVDLVNVLKGHAPDKRSLNRRVIGGLPFWILRGL